MIDYFAWTFISYVLFMLSSKIFERTGDTISGVVGFVSAPVCLISFYYFSTDFVKLVIDVLEKYLMS